jgi:hypothetical protein
MFRTAIAAQAQHGRSGGGFLSSGKVSSASPNAGAKQQK